MKTRAQFRKSAVNVTGLGHIVGHIHPQTDAAADERGWIAD